MAYAKEDENRRAVCLLVGKRVHFAHQPGGDIYSVTSATKRGPDWMLTLAELPGEFAAHIFVAAKDQGGPSLNTSQKGVPARRAK